MGIVEVIILILMIGIIGMLVWLINTISTSREQIASQSAATGLLQQQLEALKQAEDKLREETQKNLQSGQDNITKNLSTNQKLISDITNQIGKLQGTNEQMLKMGNDVRKLQDILKSPKLRGQLGEWSLENILTQVLPQGSFSLQQKLADGRIVDAMVNLDKYCVGIDAKFPLPNFEAMCAEDNETAKEKLRKALLKDVKKHIDKIAADYIRPAEGTLDFAMMYIPAENIYYETVVNTISDESDVLSYAMEKKVVPISPNLLYAYLMTIVMGLHGLQIEQQAAQIRKNLGKLSIMFNDFNQSWNTLGGHVRNVYNKFDETNQKLGKIDLQLQQMQNEDE